MHHDRAAQGSSQCLFHGNLHHHKCMLVKCCKLNQACLLLGDSASPWVQASADFAPFVLLVIGTLHLSFSLSHESNYR